MKRPPVSSTIAFVTAAFQQQTSGRDGCGSTTFHSPLIPSTCFPSYNNPICHHHHRSVTMYQRFRSRPMSMLIDDPCDHVVPIKDEHGINGTTVQQQRQPQQQTTLSNMTSTTSLEIINGNEDDDKKKHDLDETKREEDEGKEVALAILLLNAVAILWGTQHAVIKLVVDDSSAAPFTLLRFGLAALIASPYTPGIFPSSSSLRSRQEGQQLQQQEDDDEEEEKRRIAASIRTAWRWGIEMGIWMFLGFSFQALGLETTTAQRSGFLLYLNVKLVPFFSRILWGKSISIPTWISAMIAFVGTALLATDGQASIAFNIGDVWSIAAASASAMYIIRLEKATKAVKDAAQLNAACLWVVAILACIWTFSGVFLQDMGDGGGESLTTVLENNDGSLTTTPPPLLFSDTMMMLYTTIQTYPIQIIYLGGVTTTLANYIQSKGQQYISPERASIIYSLDPVYGSIFSWFLLGETIGGYQSWIGAGMITLAATTNAFIDLGSTSSNTTPNEKTITTTSYDGNKNSTRQD